MHLLRYGAHLSPMLIDLARSLVPAGERITAPAARAAVRATDDDSPYRD